VDFANFDEFWKALGRLYDDTLRINEAIDKLKEEQRALANEQRESAKELRESVKDLSAATGHLLRAVEKHQLVVESHERRLDRTEITVEAVLEDLRRHREGRPPQ
jgi:proline dehydrogenase